MKYRNVGLAMASAIAGIFLSANAASAAVTFNLNQVITGDAPGFNATAESPWLRAVFTDESLAGFNLSKPANGHVYLVLQALNLQGLEAVKDWAFNITPGINATDLRVTEVARQGYFSYAKKNMVTLATDGVGTQFMSFSFDFQFNYLTGADTSRTFSVGDIAVFDLSLLSSASLTPADFLYKAANSQGTEVWYTAAHVQNTPGSQGSGKIGAKEAYDDSVTVVPEAPTLIAGALLLLPFGASTLRIWRSRKQR